MLWSPVTLLNFQEASFGDLVHHLRWLFLRGRILGGRILALDQAQRKGFLLANRCFLCHSEGETADHILLHCAKCWILWQLLFSLFGVAWVISSSVKETLLGWHGYLWVKPARRFGRCGKKGTS